MTKWSAKKLKELGVDIPKRKKPVVKAREAPQIGEMKWVLKGLELEYKTEFEFCPGRAFRADLYVPSLNLLIEYEGIVDTENGTGQSRHTNIKGYTTDCEKYFLANVHGYRVLRVTALNYKKLSEYLKLL